MEYVVSLDTSLHDKISHKNKAHARKNSGWEKIFGQSKMAGKKVAPKAEKPDEGQKFVNEIKTKQDGS
jgi:hypothetical protein